MTVVRNVSASMVNGTTCMSHETPTIRPIPFHELCVRDLLHPTDDAEHLLQTLSYDQLGVIENALGRIKTRKRLQASSTPVTRATSMTLWSPSLPSTTSLQDKNNRWTGECASSAPEKTKAVDTFTFVYSHQRTRRRYCIQTDLGSVDVSLLDDTFKRENCVYPRANLPRETYRGNRWAYETECNELGWKLAHLNRDELAGKRGLIQRAVDSYRNRCPTMKSRRVARQEKLLSGTLRKRKHRDTTEPGQVCDTPVTAPGPTVMNFECESTRQNYLIRIDIDTVPLESISTEFRQVNCVFPRAIVATHLVSSPRGLDEMQCNEVGWKLAWLNVNILANRKGLLQRVLDAYRRHFAPHLAPRKYSSRLFHESFKPIRGAFIETSAPIALTEKALAEQQLQFENVNVVRSNDDNESCYSGTTATLDFRDCFSPPADTTDADHWISSPPLISSPSFCDSPSLCMSNCTSVSNSRITSGHNSPSLELLDDMFQQTLFTGLATMEPILFEPLKSESYFSADLVIDPIYQDSSAGMDVFGVDHLLF